jgi:hypothetical protein
MESLYWEKHRQDITNRLKMALALFQVGCGARKVRGIRKPADGSEASQTSDTPAKG